MTEKHTPGPWAFVSLAPHKFGISDAALIGQKGCHSVIGQIWSEANARLIAAAPETAAERDRLKAINLELLSALQWITEFVEDHPEWDDSYFREKGEAKSETAWMIDARAEIAKAEAES